MVQKDNILYRMKETSLKGCKRWNEKRYRNIRRRLREDEEEKVSLGRGTFLDRKYRNYGYFNDPWVSNALKNKLYKDRGKEWNDIYSELVASVKGLGKFYRYLLDQRISWIVEFDVHMVEGVPHSLGRYSTLKELNGLYVYPKAIEGGILRSHEIGPKTKKMAPVTELESEGRYYCFRYGSWYLWDDQLDNWQALNKEEMEIIYELMPHAARHEED